MNEIKVLDKGFVRFVDKMGTDRAIAEAAWVSTDACANRTDADVERVIRYLVRHKHWTPLAQVQVKLHIKMPIFIARQYMKSTVGVVYNEMSRRYVSSEPEFYEPFIWRAKPEKSIKQGSGEPLSVLDSENASDVYLASCVIAEEAYNGLLAAGVAPEQARIVLPVSCYTEVIANMSLAAAARIYSLRHEASAQREIQDYAIVMSELIQPHFPIAWKYLTENNPISGEVN